MIKQFSKVLMSSLILMVFMVTTSVAAPVFLDNFDTDVLATNQTTFNGGWTVSNGTVDVIGDPSFYDMLPGNGRYVDLDGSSSQSGFFSKDFSCTNTATYNNTIKFITA